MENLFALTCAAIRLITVSETSFYYHAKCANIVFISFRHRKYIWGNSFLRNSVSVVKLESADFCKLNDCFVH